MFLKVATKNLCECFFKNKFPYKIENVLIWENTFTLN